MQIYDVELTLLLAHTLFGNSFLLSLETRTESESSKSKSKSKSETNINHTCNANSVPPIGTAATVQELKKAKKVTTNPFAEREKREKERLLAARRKYFQSTTTPSPAEDPSSAPSSSPEAPPASDSSQAPTPSAEEKAPSATPPREVTFQEPASDEKPLPASESASPAEHAPSDGSSSLQRDASDLATSSDDSSLPEAPADSVEAISSAVETKTDEDAKPSLELEPKPESEFKPEPEPSFEPSATTTEHSAEKIKTSFYDDDSDDYSDLSSLDEDFNYDDLSSLSDDDELSEDDLVKNWPRPLTQVSAESLSTAQQGQRWDSQVVHCSIVRMAEDVANVKRVKIYSPSDSRTITGFGRVDPPSFDTKKLFFPIQHDDGHWCLVEIRPTTKDKDSVAVSVYDSVPLASEKEFFQKRWAYVNFLLQGVASARMFSIVGWKALNMDIERCDTVRSSAEDAGPFIVEVMKARCEDRPFSDVTPDLVSKRRQVTQEWISSQFGN